MSYYEDSVFGDQIVGVGWSTAEPITFSYLSSGSSFVNWSASETDKPLRPSGQLQKLWPAGNFGSGPYDFSLVPDARDLFYAGANVPTNAGATQLAKGPWYKPDGTIVLNSDRPCQALQLFGKKTGSLSQYYGTSLVVPVLNRYYREWRYTVRGPPLVMTLVGEDGTDDVYSRTPAGSTFAQVNAALALLAGDISAGHGVITATINVRTPTFADDRIILTPQEGYGAAVKNTSVLSEVGSVTATDFGGLTVDFSGNTSETIEVIT